jgi:hypothetical protein
VTAEPLAVVSMAIETIPVALAMRDGHVSGHQELLASGLGGLLTGRKNNVEASRPGPAASVGAGAASGADRRATSRIGALASSDGPE